MFDVYDGTFQNALRELHNGTDIKKYRQKEIKAGSILEVDIFPIWDTSKREIKQQIKKNKEHISNVNHRNRIRKLIQLANDNFDDSGIWVTLGYRGNENPTDYKQAVKDKNNYIRRLKRATINNGYDELKVLGVIEVSKKGRYHIHMITNFPNRDLVEKLWHAGKYPQARRLQPDDLGITGLATYIGKDLKDGKSYFASKNLTKPWLKAKVSDSKITKLKAKQIAFECIDTCNFFETKFPGYQFVEIEKRRSSYCDGVYIYVKMKKKGERTKCTNYAKNARRLSTDFLPKRE